jgi:hypothetical protein
MKLFRILFQVLTSAIAFKPVAAQNVLLNILTHNSGLATNGGTVNLEVTVCNTDATDSVPVYKLKPQISVPAAIASISTTGHTLPNGWTIVNNDGSTIRISNGTDMIPPHECRTILISVKGKVAGGPSTISGNLQFSSGIAPGSAPGGATRGDNPADNTSTSTIKVLR